MESKKIETKHDEIRYITDDPAKMLNKWLPNTVVHEWTEDFLDEDTKEVVSIKRSEVLFERGTLIDQDVLAKIKFSMAAGEIKEVEVSNQRRLAYVLQNTNLQPWTATVLIGDKKYKFLLYASSIMNVVEILTDYVELNYYSGFVFVMAKEIDSCIILEDTLSKEKQDLEKAYLKDEISMEEYVEAKYKGADDEDEIREKKFYQIDVKVTYSDNVEAHQSFIINTYDIDQAMIVIYNYLQKVETEHKNRCEERGDEYEIRDFKVSIEKAGPAPFGAFVPLEFSKAYNEK